jgi:copper chaperone CopZ
MKKVLFLPLALLLLLVAVPTVQAHQADDEVVVTVDKIVGKAKQADKLKTQLMKVEGVKNVSTCTTSGKVTVTYDKATMGCSSKLYSAMDKAGWQYSKGAACGMKKSCDKPCDKPCTKSAAPQS